MIVNLLEATKEYWRELDQLEAAYQQGEISLEEVNAQVALLMSELGQKRRAAITYALQGWQHWLTEQKEVLVGIAILLLMTYGWLLVKGL